MAVKKVKWSRYRPGVAQRLGRGIALLFHDRGTRRGWVVSRTPRPHFTPGKDPVSILQEAGWAPGPVWTGGKSCPHRDSIPDRPTGSQSLYRLSYPAHIMWQFLPTIRVLTAVCLRIQFIEGLAAASLGDRFPTFRKTVVPLSSKVTSHKRVFFLKSLDVSAQRWEPLNPRHSHTHQKSWILMIILF